MNNKSMIPVSRSLARLAAAGLLMAASVPVLAVPVLFTDRAVFDAAIAGFTQSTLDFESASAGDIIADGGSLGGITFDYSTLAGYGISMAVTDGAQYGGGGPYPTTSGSNFLGTDDGDVFQSGDDFSLSFGSTNAVGMYFLSADSLFDDDIQLSAGGATVSLDSSMIQQSFIDNSSAFFLGIVDMDSAFTSADITSLCCGYFLFNVDDIVTAEAPAVVPLPASLPLFGIGLAGLAMRLKRRR